MAAEIGLISLKNHQTLAQPQQHQYPQSPSHSERMWNSKQDEEEDDSWEVRAFAVDTSNIMGSTWPPRSYSCTFCRREFRSAQALGGHMNVHRRDRARLHQLQPQPGSICSIMSPDSSSTRLNLTQELPRNGDSCFLYQFPGSNNAVSSIDVNSGLDYASTLLSASSHLPCNLISPMEESKHTTCQCCSNEAKQFVSIGSDNNDKNDNQAAMEEVDLELRLGHRTQPS